MSHYNLGSRQMILFLCSIYVFCLTQFGSSFNIDTIRPLVYEDPAAIQNARESYFGYSLQFLFNQKDNAYNSAKWLLVGAPRANSTFPSLANITEPGQVYRCVLGKPDRDQCQPLIIEREASQNNRDKFYRDRKDYGWLGGAMSVNSPSTGRVAICGYRWSNRRLSTEHYMNGVCYWSGHQVSETEDFVKVLPIVAQDQQVTGTDRNGTYNYAYGQSGFSVHMVQKQDQSEEMIIGAPGVFKWTGAVVRVSDYLPNSPSGVPSRKKRQDKQDIIEFGETTVSASAKISRLEPNDYFGYSVHSGIFFNDGKLLYVSGAPRAAQMQGKVLIFDFLHSGKDSQLKIHLELNGTQLGEYFGASVLAVDLTGDGKSELLVGAPQHSLRPEMADRTGDEGKVYFYLNRNGNLQKPQALYGSKARDARFGTAMASVGDINLDGFNDVVIGAPYENDRGAVYLYLGGMNDIRLHPETGYWQRIAAADFVFPLNNLRGFGISLVAADMDGNSYPDLAVGSFLSGHALVFRSSPVIQLALTMKVNNGGLIDPDGGSVMLSVCSSFESKFSVPEICVGYTFHFDAEYINQPRLILDVDGNQQQPFNYTGILSSGSPSCRKFKLTVANTPYYSQDFSRPAIFRLTAMLLKNVRPLNNTCRPMTDQSLTKDPAGSMRVLIAGGAGSRDNEKDTFCATCPVVDETQKSYVENSAAFTSECGSDNICQEDLDVEANFISDSKEFVVGSRKTLSFEVRLVNHGEPSYLTTIEIQLPIYTNLKRTPADLCQKPSIGFSDELIYSCQLRVNPLKRAKTEKMEFEIDMTSISSGGNNDLTVLIEARMNTAAAMGRRPRFNLTIPLKTAIDVEIMGNSIEEQQTYQRPNDTTTVTIVKERLTFKHLYEVRNVLPSAAKVEIEVLVPVSVLSRQGVTLYLVELATTSVDATQKGGQSNSLCHLDYNSGQSMDVQEFRESISSSPIVKSQPAFKFAQANRTAFIDCFNTKSVSCVKYVCSVFGTLSPESPVTVSLTGTLHLQNIFSFAEKKDVFILSSAARVTIRQPANIQQPFGHKPDIAIASTHFLPQGPPGTLAVASWIIVLAVLAGILLLSLMVVGLHKMGFFKRQRYPQDALVDDGATPGDGSSEDMDNEPQPNA